MLLVTAPVMLPDKAGTTDYQASRPCGVLSSWSPRCPDVLATPCGGPKQDLQLDPPDASPALFAVSSLTCWSPSTKGQGAGDKRTPRTAAGHKCACPAVVNKACVFVAGVHSRALKVGTCLRVYAEGQPAPQTERLRH